MQDFMQLALERQSVRRYDTRAVEPEKMVQCLEAARMAPSASNSQPWSFVVVQSQPLLEQVARATFSDIKLINQFTLQAPAMVVMVLEKAKPITRLAMMVKNKEWPLIDIGLAASQFCLQATDLGLGTCMIGWFKEDAIRKLLKIPSSKTVALLISIGYAAEGYPQRAKVRKKLADIAWKEQYEGEGF